MALRAVISSKIPTVIILGATGTGKTKLGVELAQKFGTEIISADSMQVYKGLDIVTAKASRQEQELVKHHLLDILEPHQMFTVVDFRNRVLKLIERFIEEGKMPIIVGGTNYYIEAVVYNILVESMDDENALLWEKTRKKRPFDEIKEIDEVPSKIPREQDGVDCEPSTSSNNKANDTTKAPTNLSREQLKENLDNEANFTTKELHSMLMSFDPISAKRLHPNNRRKIIRSMEVYVKTGRLNSEILAAQKSTEGQLRKPDSTIILWLRCEQSVHDARLDARVEGMLDDGLIAELLNFHEKHNRHRITDGPPDYTKGVFQTMGFKEFHDYLMMWEEERASVPGQTVLRESIENMKVSTKRFARRQIKMIRKRFLEHPNRQVPNIYELDTTDLAKWDEDVKNKAIQIIESFQNNSLCPSKPLQPKVILDKDIDRCSYNYCDACKRVFIGDHVYAIHMASTTHKKKLDKIKKEGTKSLHLNN